jgi:hypothetical protein
VRAVGAHMMQVYLFVAGLEDAQLVAGSGDVAWLKVQAQPGPWGAVASPSCRALCAAFVVGVANYPVPYQLPVCLSDAEDMAWLLHRKGYNVTRLLNPTHAHMKSSFIRFQQSLRRDTQVVFFFAGHGMQLAGANYLVPVDGIVRHAEGTVKGAVGPKVAIASRWFAPHVR